MRTATSGRCTSAVVAALAGRWRPGPTGSFAAERVDEPEPVVEVEPRVAAAER